MLSISGCATFKPSTIIGASIGATVGSLAGTMIGGRRHPVTGAFVGAGAGLATGGLAGFLFGEATAPKQSVGPRVERLETDSRIPPVSQAEVSCVEVPARIDGNKYYKRREVCTIEKGAVWMME